MARAIALHCNFMSKMQGNSISFLKYHSILYLKLAANGFDCPSKLQIRVNSCELAFSRSEIVVPYWPRWFNPRNLDVFPEVKIHLVICVCYVFGQLV